MSGIDRAMKDEVDARWLSGIIGEIYDCALAPGGWNRVVASIITGLSFHSGVLGILQVRQFSQTLNVHHGMDEAWLGASDLYVEDSVNLWGGPARVQSYPLDEPIVASEIMPKGEWVNNRYYREILGPRDLVDGIALGVAREPQLVGYLALNRHSSQGLVGSRHVESLRLIAPHLRRAITISNLFDLKAVESATFQSVLDGLSATVVLVDEELRIVHVNRAGEAMLAAGDVVQSLQGRLAVRGRIADDALRTAMRVAVDDETRLAQRGIGVPATSKDGSPVVLHVLPLRRGALRPGLVQHAAAAVFIAEAGAHAPTDAIAALYDFTPAEARLFAALARGGSLADATADLGIARSTAKTHLLRIFAKTGCSRQAELVALGARHALNL